MEKRLPSYKNKTTMKTHDIKKSVLIHPVGRRTDIASEVIFCQGDFVTGFFLLS